MTGKPEDKRYSSSRNYRSPELVCQGVSSGIAAEDTVMLHGTAENYVVGKSAVKTEDPSMMEKAATIYWDKDENGAYSEGDDMVAVFEGYSAEEITAAKDSWMYVKSEAVV